MKIIIKMLLMLLGIALFGVGTIKAEASADKAFIIEEKEGAYVLLNDGEKIASSESLGEILLSEFIKDGSEIFFKNVSVREDITLENTSVIFSGSIIFSDGNFVINDASVNFNSLSAEFSSGGIILNSAKLAIEDSNITAHASSAVSLLSGEGTCLVLFSGELSSFSEYPAIYADVGTLELFDGKVSSVGGCAINSKVPIAFEKCILSGREYDVFTSSPIRLIDSIYCEEAPLRIRFDRLFERGSITEVVYCKNAEALRSVRFFDKEGREEKAEYFAESRYSLNKSFCAIYKPFSVVYYYSDISVMEKKLLSGETVLSLLPEEKAGYRFSHFSFDASGENIVSSDVKADRDMSIYLNYELMPCEYSINPLRCIYDGEEKTLGLSNVSHPLLNFGELSYEWYFNGELISREDVLRVKNTTDSGAYKCKLSFTYMGDFSITETEEIEVSIDKRELFMTILDARAFSEGDIPEYTLSGDVIPGDDPAFFFYRHGDEILCRCENENYDLKLDSGKIVNDGYKFLWIILPIISFSLGLALVLFFVIRERYVYPQRAYTNQTSGTLISRDENDAFGLSGFEITRARADALVSDESAKALIRKGKAVFTFGKKRESISLDTIVDSFSEGEQVDINAMKRKGILPPDVGFVKLLSGARINKRLTVYANEFSLPAVKMIALCGGFAIRVKSVRKKHKRKEQE